jgi:hypothetical protein
MTQDEIAIRPNLSFLSREDKEKIDRAAFQILNEIMGYDECQSLIRSWLGFSNPER